MCRKKKTEMMRKGEEIRQYTVKECRKFCNYVKNLTNEYQPWNLNVLYVNGQLLSENKKAIDGGIIFEES